MNIWLWEQLSDESEPTVSYYMPHQGSDSKSTPLRTVFDASCSTSTGESLNSILANSGDIQDDLFAILLRFRKNKIALTSDIKKMFRMIFIDESQRDLLRIVWKDSINDSIKTYRMNRVVGAGMQLHKWYSNCIKLLSNFDVSDGDVSPTIPDETKALGLLWRPQKDTLAFSVSSIADVSDSSTITKRSVLSATARIFDLLSLISLVVTKVKLVMQELWRLKLDWNDSLPIHLETQWKRFVKSLAAINNTSITLYILLDDALIIELHGYCDSSLRAYGAAIYVKRLHNLGELYLQIYCAPNQELHL
ncbi:uncharacterized protein TNCV_1252651 [Trichonephila clavipes]|nr:uncharacterized protein TNCV_1252651 [Trichonephila clavipes]